MKKTSAHKRVAISILEQLTVVYIACMFSVYLLFPGLGGYRTITEGKWRLLCVLSGGYIILSMLFSAELVLLGDQRLLSLRERLKKLSLPKSYYFAIGLPPLFQPYFQSTEMPLFGEAYGATVL